MPAPLRTQHGSRPLDTGRRRQHYRIAALMILFISMVAPATAIIDDPATAIIDDELLEIIDTSKSGYVPTQKASSGGLPGALNSIVIKDITKFQHVSYFDFVINGNQGYEGDNYLSSGVHDTTYTFNGQTKPCRIYISRATNIAGQITSTKFTIFFEGWDIGSLSGTQWVNTPYSFYKGHVTGKTTGTYWDDNPTDIALTSSGSYKGTWDQTYQAGHATGLIWKNHIRVNELSGDIDGYDILLNRTVNGIPYHSDLNIYKDGLLVFTNSEFGTDINIWYPLDSIDKINITSPAEVVYNYPLKINPDDPDVATVAVYIQNSQTGDLLTGAHLTVIDSHASSTPAIDQDLPTGTGTFTLEKADTLRYHASATADGYTLLSPILFGVGGDGATIVLWMAPDAPPDDPIEEGKSMLYGYVQTQGSQQPISGATVALDGYGSTTTSSTGFYIFNNVTPATLTLSASATLHDALSEPVTVDATATQHNLALTGHYLLTVTVKDGDTLANLQNATISLSDGQESTQNPVTFNGDYGPYSITAAAGGYYPVTQSTYLDHPGTTTATVLMTAIAPTPTPPEMPNYPPHNVKFTVQTLLGTPIPGVNVTAQGIQQTPSQNILERLLGINTTSTPITTELMSGTTDTNGEINFMMVEAVKYQISIYKPDVVNQTLEIYPKEDTYPIIISTAGGPLLPDAGDALRDIRINVTTSTEGDTGHILVDYNDTTRKTTGLSIQVTQQNTTNTSAPEDVIASHTVANDANVTHTFDLSVYKGQSFFVRLEAEHPDFGTVHRDYAVAFKGVRVPLGPLPDGLYIYVAGFGLMLLGGIFGATSATRGVVVIAFAGWLFWGFGWLDDLGLIAPASLGLVSTIAVMGVIVTRYKEEGYT